MNYTDASAKLTGRNRERRKLENNTYLERRNESTIAIRLHDTDIITLTADGTVTLNSGGWRTVTTKARMNEFLDGISISQERGLWYVERQNPEYKGWEWNEAHPEEKQPYWLRLGLYQDGMTISAKGKIKGMEPIGESVKAQKLRKRVQRYAAAYIKALFDGKVPAPGAGDCFYCQMREVGTGKPLGECTGDHGHILSHISEKYYVPSLLHRAFEVMPVSQAMKWAVAEQWQPKAVSDPSTNPIARQGNTWAQGFVVKQIQKTLSRYVLRQLGQAA